MTILIVYSATRPQIRTAVADHLYSFQRHSGARCIYVNLAVRRLPRQLRTLQIDLIIFHNTLLDARWSPRWFNLLTRRARPLRDIAATKVALVQDEYILSDLVSEFIKDQHVTRAFSAAPATEWPKIYPYLDRSLVGFDTVLTGYLSRTALETIARVAGSTPERDLDISYRAWRAPAWLGRHGFLKTEIANSITVRARALGMRVDVSNRQSDTKYGDEWFRLLLRSRYVVGVEGGASLLDRDGTIRARTEKYTRLHPDASFDEIEAACFPGVDGGIAYFAISPRHLEACATRTGQILVEGAYNGVLEPWTHYLPLRKDLSNLDDILEAARDEPARVAMVERAHRDVVESGRYDYEHLVRQVVSEAIGVGRSEATGLASASDRIHRSLQRADRRSWRRVRALRLGIDAGRGVARHIRGHSVSSA